MSGSGPRITVFIQLPRGTISWFVLHLENTVVRCGHLLALLAMCLAPAVNFSVSLKADELFLHQQQCPNNSEPLCFIQQSKEYTHNTFKESLNLR